jgi:DNA end-binding protein Ku
MARALWKGAIAFGLVHVPVALYPASSESEIDFDWIDKRSLDPVGYRRVNKRTGKEVAPDDIVKGVKTEGGDYVVLGRDEIAAAYPKTTKTIEIEGFVAPAEVPFVMLEKPYYLEPAERAARVYALLREALHAAGVVGIARLVLHTKEHLAVLVAVGPALMIDTLRWPAEVRPWNELELPAPGRQAVKDSELAMARKLIGEMTGPWQPDRYSDRFGDAIRKLVAARVKAGRTEQIEPFEQAPAAADDNVVDLTALLAKSLERKPARKSAASEGAARKRAANEGAAQEGTAHEGASRKRA